MRIEPGRLRRAIELYYLSDGRDDPVRIDIPKGSYVPKFYECPCINSGFSEVSATGLATVRPPPAQTQRRWLSSTLLFLVLAGATCFFAAGYMASDRQRAESLGVAPVRPSIIVMPFSDLAEGGQQPLLSRTFVGEVLTQLSRFKTIIVYDQKTTSGLVRSAEYLRDGTEPGVAYTLDGSIARDADELRGVVRLMNERSKEIIWADSFHRLLKTGHLYTLQEQIAADVATEVAQPIELAAQIGDIYAASPLPDDLVAYRESPRPMMVVPD